MAAYSESISDSISLTESRAIIIGLVRGASDTFVLSDSESNILNNSEFCLDSISFVDEAIVPGLWTKILITPKVWTQVSKN